MHQRCEPTCPPEQLQQQRKALLRQAPRLVRRLRAADGAAHCLQQLRKNLLLWRLLLLLLLCLLLGGRLCGRLLLLLLLLLLRGCGCGYRCM